MTTMINHDQKSNSRMFRDVYRPIKMEQVNFLDQLYMLEPKFVHVWPTSFQSSCVEPFIGNKLSRLLC